MVVHYNNIIINTCILYLFMMSKFMIKTILLTTTWIGVVKGNIISKVNK